MENGELGTKMSILALLVSKIWRFYPFWVGLGSILKLLEPNFGVTNNLECMKLSQMDSARGKMEGIGTKMSILALLVSEIWYFTHFVWVWGQFWDL